MRAWILAAAAVCVSVVSLGAQGQLTAADIQRLLKERPAIVGLAVPGMPAGSPGMEVSSGQVQPYNVIAFDKTGKTTVFASHR